VYLPIDDSMKPPNDIAIMDTDILFASDPDWKNSKDKFGGRFDGAFYLFGRRIWERQWDRGKTGQLNTLMLTNRSAQCMGIRPFT